MLYSGGSDADKATIFYMQVEDPKTHIVENTAPQLISAIENIVIIACIVVGDIMTEKAKKFDEEKI